MPDLETGVGAGAPTSPEPAPRRHPSRGRSVTVVICLVLAGLLATPAALAYWGQRTLNDGQRYIDTVGPLIDAPEVQDAIATKVTDAIQQQVDVQALIDDVFSGVITDRPRLEQLVGPLSAAINNLIERQVREFIASDQFADFWTRVNTRAQQALHRVLTGDESGAVSLQNGQVVLDVDEVIDQVKAQLADRGLTLVANAPIPETDRQIVLLDAPKVDQLRTIYAFANPVARWLLPLVGLLFLVAFVVAFNRPRVTVWIGAIIAANGLLLAIALSVGRQLFINQLAGTTFGPASRVFYDTLLTYLERGQKVALWLGIILLLAGLFAGANSYSRAVRGGVSGNLESVGARLPEARMGATGRWVAANAAWLRVAIVVLGVVVLLWGNAATTQRLWWSLVLVVVLLAVLQVLVGSGRKQEAPTVEELPAAAPS
jgi:hypothetical protein